MYLARVSSSLFRLHSASFRFSSCSPFSTPVQNPGRSLPGFLPSLYEIWILYCGTRLEMKWSIDIDLVQSTRSVVPILWNTTMFLVSKNNLVFLIKTLLFPVLENCLNWQMKETRSSCQTTSNHLTLSAWFLRLYLKVKSLILLTTNCWKLQITYTLFFKAKLCSFFSS